MTQKKLNSGIIYTNLKCIGCNKCISGCIAVGANVVVKDPELDQYSVLVDPNKCILCGHCVEECVHKARTYRDDTDDFFEALERGEAITILVAPSLLSDYEKKYNHILGYLKHLGVRHIYNSGFGADIMVWVYMNFIHDFGLTGVISQFCPVIVNYLEKYKPELLEYLMPVQSPMMCTAIYVSDYLKNTDKLAYIDPCIAEKYEIEDVNTYGKVSYNITFERLMERLNKVDFSGYYAEDEVSYGLGALVSSAGGLSDNIQPFLGFQKVLIQTSGYRNIFPYFDHYYQQFSEGGELPFLVDVLSCTNGCSFGTGTVCGVQQRNEVAFSAHRAKEKAYKSGNVPTGATYEERLDFLNKRFKEFEASSFVRQYNKVGRVKHTELSDETIDNIFLSMYKDTFSQQHTDCGSCGYHTCRDMAYAIGMNLNHKENCINYSKQRIRLETEKTESLLVEISAMNEELKKSTQLKTNFLANMSHEIRTPMNAVIGMAEMALRGELPEEERGYIQQIKVSGHSLLAIINDILDFSKIESGKMEINETDYTVMSLLNDTANIVLTRIGEKDLTLMVIADPELPLTLRGDDIRIKQVLVNLANNAVKFTQSGCVEISIRHEPAPEGVMLTVAVRDTGIGIKPEDADKLFTSFQQVDSKRNRNIEGTGLGLAIAREFIQLMGGEIHVESAYGHGSTFSFSIPQKIVDATPSVSLKSSATIKTATLLKNIYVKIGYRKAISKMNVSNTPCTSLDELKIAVEDGAEFIFIEYSRLDHPADAYARTLKNVQTIIIADPRKDIVTAPYAKKLNQPIYSLNVAAVLNNETLQLFGSRFHGEKFRFIAPDAHVLIVDDNAINLTVAKGLLSPLHMNITTASGAREAIKLIVQNRFDIVMMDHMMPDVDGIEATHMIRAMEGKYYQNLPIIALTANAINNAREMFLREGMNDFVAKPIELEDIAAKIEKWLPAEMIKPISAQAELDIKDNDSGSSDKMPTIEGIDVEAGVALSGTVELYRKILPVYCASIEKKADLIERYAAEGDITNYTIEVHALKSSSRLIGATELSELAARLEQCGHQMDTAGIAADTDELLRRYRAYIPILAPNCPTVSELPENIITPAELSRLLGLMYSALDNFDINNASDIMHTLQCCKLEAADSEYRSKLRDAVDSVEYDDALEVITQWQEQLDSKS